MKKGEMLSKMLVIATNAHAGQFDRGGMPYILHPLKIMHYVRAEADEELACIALGHDLFEDTDITAEDLRNAGMTERVINSIYALTKMPGETLNEYKAKVKGNTAEVIL